MEENEEEEEPERALGLADEEARDEVEHNFDHKYNPPPLQHHLIVN